MFHSYRQEFSNVEDNNEQVQGASRKVQNVDDRIAQKNIHSSS